MSTTSEKKVSYKGLTVRELYYAGIRKKTYFELGMFLMVFLILLIFALIPTIDTLDSVNERIAFYTGLNGKVDDKLSLARSLNQLIFVDLKEELEFLRDVAPDIKKLHLVYLNIYLRAKQANVSITSINLADTDRGARDPDPFYRDSYFFKLKLAGSCDSFNDVIKFIELLEPSNFPILSRIDSIGIVKDENSTSPEAFRNQGTVAQQSVSFNVEIVILEPFYTPGS